MDEIDKIRLLEVRLVEAERAREVAEQALEGARRAREAYDDLIDRTSDICNVKYHYFCSSEQVDLPTRIAIGASVRPLSFYHDKIAPANPSAPLQLEEHATRKLVQFRPRTGKQSEARLQEWRQAFKDDVTALRAACGRDETFICFPEFSLPFGLARETLEIGANDDDVLLSLKSGEFLKNAFICLGSAHVVYNKPTNKGSEKKYHNIAVAYPVGLDAQPGLSSLPKEIFDAAVKRARASLNLPSSFRAVVAASYSNPIAIDDFKDDHVPLTLQFDAKGERQSASTMSEMRLLERNPALKDHKLVKVGIELFKFAGEISRKVAPEQYIFKQRPAAKLSENIDNHGMASLDIYVTPRGTVGVLICYDAYVPSIFMSAVRILRESDKRRYFNHPKVDMYFVPAFNRSSKLPKICRRLSAETHSIVVYLNNDGSVIQRESNGEAHYRRFQVFIEGFEAISEAKRYAAMGYDSPIDTSTFSAEHMVGIKIIDPYFRAYCRRATGTSLPLPKDQVPVSTMEGAGAAVGF